jgi:hypothetical protein
MLGQIRKDIKPLLRKIAKIISVIPLTANQFTFLAIPLSGVAAYFLATENYLYGLDLLQKQKNKKASLETIWMHW